MALWQPSSSSFPTEIEDLDVSVEQVHRAMFRAVTDSQLCTEDDAPTAKGLLMWTRSNRYIREELVPEGWTRVQAHLILRTVHPTGRFCISAVSGSGHVGSNNRGAQVQAKNPKGSQVKKLIEATTPMIFGDPRVDVITPEPPDIAKLPTCFLLYKPVKNGVEMEVSYPKEMEGNYLDRWHWRIPLPRLEVPGFTPGDDGPAPDSDVPVDSIE